MKLLKQLINEFSIFPTGPMQTAPMNPEDNSINFGTGDVNGQNFEFDNTDISGDSDIGSSVCPCCGRSGEENINQNSQMNPPDTLNNFDDEVLTIGSDDPDNLRTPMSDDDDEFEFMK